MPSWQGRSKGTPLGYRIFVWVLRNFGVLPGYFLLRFVAFYYFLFSYTASKNIYHFFHRKIGFSSLSSLGKLYRNYYLFGQTIIDKVVLMSGIPNRFTFNFDGEENLRKMVLSSKLI